MQTKIISVGQLAPSEVEAMHEIMLQYYNKIKKEKFVKDLFEKSKVILLLGPDQSIKGFSTILEQPLKVRGRTVTALYSGDTVLSREHWGNGALAMAFGRYLIETKLKNPFRPVYWFLISKGYKTYLLMANNFQDHYPRFECATPVPYMDVMDAFYGERFGGKYFSLEGIIRFEDGMASPLKNYVADISDEDRENPRIAFFEKKNPHWKDGVELACVAKVSIWVPVCYIVKRIRKAFLTHGKGLKTFYYKQH